MARNKDFFVNSTPKRDRSFFVKEDATPKKQNINIDVKPVNISGFVQNVKNEAKQKETKVEQDIINAGYKSNDFTEDQKKQLISGNYSINPTYNPDNKFSQKLIYTGDANIKATPTLGQRVINTAEKSGRTAMDLIGNVATGVTKGMEGYVDTAVGAGGTALSGLSNLVGQKELSQNIKNKAEQIAGYGFAKDMQNLVNEKSQQGAGIYNPSVLGLDARDAAQEIARMYSVGMTGGLPGLMVSATGGNIEEALNEGESLGRATTYGAISGSLEGIVEKMFDPAKILGGGLKTIGKGFLGKIAEATVGEGAEEGITAALNPFIKMLTYKGDVENPFGSWDNFKNYLRDIGQSVYQGAIIGGLTLGVSAPGNVDLQKSFRDDVHKAVEKIQGVNQARKNEIANTILEGANQTENVAGLPKTEAQNQAQNQNIERTNVITPNRAKMPQNANMEQIAQAPNLPTQKAQETLQSAKIAGMTDMDIQKAKELNDMLRSGTRLNFYDEKTIPQNVQADKAKIANGFYKDGTLWINKNSKNKVEQILGHELTHHLETTDSYTDLSNTILDSEVFYDFIAEKGYANVAEYKTKLKEMGYNDAQLDNELVARFVEEKMFTDQKSIDRLARQNTKLVEKIKNWISDLVVSFKGTAQEKELRRIENMYRKALEQVRSSAETSTEAKYSFAGTKAKTANFAKFSEAQKLDDAGISAEEIFKRTGWYRGNEGRWRFEIDDSKFNIKQNAISPYMTYELADILEAEELFEAYPELRTVEVAFDELPEETTGSFNPKGKWITLNNDLIGKNTDLLTQEYLGIRNQGKVFSSLMHEVQHYIQAIEGFTQGTSLDKVYNDTIKDAKQYAESLPAFKELKTTQEKAQFVEDYIKMTTDKRAIYSKYRNQGGEQEARNVQERIKLTKEEKANMLPFIKNEDTLYANDNDVNYSIAGTKAMKNINDTELINAYNEAVRMKNNKADNETIRRTTGWFQDKNGAWKFEFSDKDMKLKDDVQILRDKTYRLEKLLKHDVLFTAYPQLRNYKIEFTKLKDGVDGNHVGLTSTIQIDPDKVRSKADVEGIIIHELQHVIQKIEGFERGASSKKSKLAYYTSLGEIEAADTRRRLELERDNKLNRKEVAPESSKANPKHEGLDNYLSKRTEKDIEKDNKFLQRKGIRLGGVINEESMGTQNTELPAHPIEQVSSMAGDVRRLAGKEPAFSMPETDNQGRTLSKEQQEFFKDSKVRDENGKLLEVYHGTENKFNIYKSEYNEFFFTDSEIASRDYGSVSKKQYLNLINPYEVDYAGGYDKRILDDIDYAKANGYDGVIARNTYDGANTHTQYVAFEPNQIKNVDNTNPTENPDIRYSMNPVEVAKNPPNIETGLESVKKKKPKVGNEKSKLAESIQASSIFSDEVKKLIEDDIKINTYDRISNKETMQKANDKINENGQEEVLKMMAKSSKSFTTEDVATGIILMDRYQKVGDYESAVAIMQKLREAGTSGGQMVQTFSLLGRMTPEGMTYYAQKELSDAYDEILKNKTQAWADEHADEFKLTGKDIEFIQRRVNQASRLPEGRDKNILLAEIAERIQRKIPPQAGQSIKALARNSMLLNPKTMVRNVLGNVVIMPNHIISDFVGAGIDKAVSKKTNVRTTGITNVKDMLQGAKKGVYESFDDFRRGISTRGITNDRFEISSSGRSFNEHHTGKFAETRNRINKALNGLDRVTGFLLETGDRPFYEAWFINSLNSQMKLNNVTEPTAEMIEIATDEALQRTWQDSNTYTKAVTGVRNTLNRFNIKGYGLGDMVMPFVKTPANLTKAVVDFSPLGAINAAIKTSQFNKDIGKGTATTKQQREVVKAWSQVITGSLGMAILTAMANAGTLTGGGDEDKDVRAFEQNVLGIKPYSIKIGDKTYTYDWAQPLGTSAAMVADTVKSLKNANNTQSKAAAVLQGAQSGASVLLEQSFISGIRNLFEEDNLINALIETAANEPSKFTPQFLGQIAQVGDDTARTSYVYNDKVATGINKVKAKIPGLRQTLEPSVDVLGREVKTDNSVGNVMFNPANTAFARTTEGAEEMYRVYQATGDKATIAQVAPYYFNVGNEKIVLTPKQRTQYQKTIGKIASDGVENLLKNKAYEGLEDTDKAEILKDLYSYGTAIAKAEASTSYLLPSAMQKIKDSRMSPEEYILLKYISNLGGTKKDDMYNSLISAGYSQKDTQEFLTDYKGYKFNNTSNKLPTLSSQRAKLPTLKK